MKKLVLLSLLAAACGAPPEEKDGNNSVVVVITDDETNNGVVDDGTTNNNGATTNNGVTNGSNNGEQVLEGIPLLGNGQHSLDAVDFRVIATADDNLRTPRDLAFNPAAPTELWIVNLDDNSTVVIDNPGAENQSAQRYGGLGKDHFMASSSSLAFGDNGNFGTAQDTDEATQAQTPDDFMGPTLWTSDRTIYDGGHGGHLDMLHNSPNGAGIAWETENVYWVFDGYHNSLTRYDFNEDHGPGGSDHTDGDVARYVDGEVSYVDGVPSHLEFHQDLNLLYVADSGNNRIAVLDPSIGTPGQSLSPNYDGGRQYYVSGTQLDTLVDGADVGLEMPSGLAISGDTIYVGDNMLSRIVALDFEGNLVDYLDLSSEIPAGGLMGIEIAPDGSLFAVDGVSNQIIRVAASEAGPTD